ncbi:hypothetical protein DGG96_18230 [Legionella qingyii]|uniref:Uncharacterized protein n=1 Tax=Legionella qingyii TaxID=2184757 RepID=A0A317U131_9GAMM|nr:hypothetical protein [Legionella qingyii]PWY54212.1 hypothetical protein DGG96_18230 [Legionella qingyii]RUR19816.1 hypothetical protein ELY20_15470 [Legionella qingyii]RUR22176.1 hypothetical protein ELY16_15210 [Legionella qingyii]
MKIYFPDITFEGNPFVWELNEKSNQATCLMYCIKKDTQVQFVPKMSLDLFKKFPGITYDKDEIIIRDIKIFDKVYQILDHIRELKDKITGSKATISRQKSSFFQYQKDKIQEVASTSKPRRSLSLSSTNLSLFTRITLNELIKNDQSTCSLWGDTVAYENYFEEKTSNDAKARGAIFLKSSLAFNIMVQYEKNRRLYPLKAKVIKEIRALLDVLDPIYVSWYSKEGIQINRELVFHYFQNAVLEAMLNGNFNNKPTEFETEETPKLNAALQKYAIEKARALRAELMLMKFNIFINPELPPELALSDNEINTLPEIISLRKLVLKQPEEVLEAIHAQLKKLTQLIIESGIVEESNAELSTQLNHSLSINAPVIMDFHSFQALIFTLLDQQITGSKKELIPDIVTKVTTETINQIIKTFKMTNGQYLAPLYKIDSNFYLCKEWADKLSIELAEVKLKHPKEEKKVTVYSQAIADKVVGFMSHQLQKYQPSEDDLSRSSSLSVKL